MNEKSHEHELIGDKKEYEAPHIIQKREIVIDLNTNILTDEPPPPM